MFSRVAAHPSPRMRCGASTAVGNRRTVNEDALHVGAGWFIVADGMGGHGSGDVASSVVVETFERDVVGWRERSVDHVRELVARANRTVIERAAADGTTGMGSTVVGVGIVGRPAPAIVVFHVGDSRCYQLGDGRLQLVTTDHRHVQELVDAGELDPALAEQHPLRNVITRAIGIDTDVRPDVRVLPTRATRLLLCSDGLSGELGARAIGRVLTGFDDPDAAARRLVELTLAGPARDNVTALVVDIELDGVAADDSTGDGSTGEGWTRCA